MIKKLNVKELKNIVGGDCWCTCVNPKATTNAHGNKHVSFGKVHGVGACHAVCQIYGEEVWGVSHSLSFCPDDKERKKKLARKSAQKLARAAEPIFF
jgi:bacteriocin-like protein